MSYVIYNFRTILLIFLISTLFSVNCNQSQNQNNNSSLPMKKEKCYVLALEGGGDKGAYQSGALQGLVELANNTQWDVITGVSVGALNGAALSIFEVGKEKEAVEYLIDSWRKIKSAGDIYDNWWLGPLWGLFFKTGLFDTEPLKKKLDSIIQDSKIKRKFVCGTTNFLTGEYETFDEETLSQREVINAVASSASVPVIFPLNYFRKNYYMDGGVKNNLDIASGVYKCHDMGYKDKDIVLDAIMLNSAILPEQNPSGVHALGVLNRIFEIFGFDHAMRDIEIAREVFPDLNFRYAIAPTMKLPSGSVPLIFSPKEIEDMIKFGFEDAKTAVNLGPRRNFDILAQMYKEEIVKTHLNRPRRQVNKSDKKSEALGLNKIATELQIEKFRNLRREIQG